MIRSTLIVASLIAWLVQPAPAEPGPAMKLSYEQALALARGQAPTLAVAQARLGEAEGRVDAAAVRRFNPQVQASVGPRFGDAVRLDASVRATQWLELGGRPGRRVAAAQAELEAGEARRDDAERLLLREVGRAFVRALYWRERAAIAEHNLELAREVEAVARRRHEVGDVGGLARSSAALAVAEAQLELDGALAGIDEAEGELAVLLGIATPTDVDAIGELRALAIAPTPAAELDERPDLRALAAEARAAEAERALGRSLRAPNLLVGAGYTLEESDHVVLGIVGLSLPVFDRGQGTVAVAEAREARADVELEATRTAATAAAASADAVARRASEAALAFEREGLAALQQTEQIMTVSWQKGAVSYDEVLALRQQLVAARVDYIELLRIAADARVELSAATGAEVSR